MITHIVKKTDTLEGISVKYNVSIAKIKKVNKIWSNNVLLCMDKILIPEEEDLIASPSQSKPGSIYSGIESKSNNSYSSLPYSINNNYNNNINYNNNNNNYNNSYNQYINNMNVDNSNNNYVYNNIPDNVNYNNIPSNNYTYHDNYIYNNNYNPFIITYSESAPNSPVIRGEAPGSVKSYNGVSNRVKGDSVSETINYNNLFISSSDNNNNNNNDNYNNNNNNTKKKYKRSTSDLSSLDELFESIDKSVMDSVNKNNITLPLLIKTQLEVYQDIPTYDPSKDKTMQKSYSIGCIDKNKKEPNLNNSQSTVSLNLDGYKANDDYNESPTEYRKSFLRHEQDKINKIMDKLSISSNMDGIHNFVSRLSSRDHISSISEPANTSKLKQNGDYLELAKIV